MAGDSRLFTPTFVKHGHFPSSPVVLFTYFVHIQQRFRILTAHSRRVVFFLFYFVFFLPFFFTFAFCLFTRLFSARDRCRLLSCLLRHLCIMHASRREPADKNALKCRETIHSSEKKRHLAPQYFCYIHRFVKFSIAL